MLKMLPKQPVKPKAPHGVSAVAGLDTLKKGSENGNKMVI